MAGYKGRKEGEDFQAFFTKNKKYNKIEEIWIRFSLNSERIVPRLDKDRGRKNWKKLGRLRGKGSVKWDKKRLLENFRLVEDSLVLNDYKS